MAEFLDLKNNDKELVAHFLHRRDEAAFLKIYKRHSSSLNRLILRLTSGHATDAEDVVQIMWIRAIENLSYFRWESSLKTWLTGIAINCYREYMHRSKRERSYELIDAMDQSRVSKINQQIDPLDLERAIASLPDGYREVLILHDIEGYTHDEIAQFLEIVAGTSKSQLSRARKAVRIILTKEKDGYKNDRKLQKRPEQRGAGGLSITKGGAAPLYR